MTVNNTADASERGGKSQKSRSSRTAKADATDAQAPTIEPTVTENSSKTTDGEAMSNDNIVKITARPISEGETPEETSIRLHQPTSMVWNRPVMPSEVEVVETMTVAGVRPIAASHLELFGSFLNGRPIEASHLTVRGTLPGDRPIFNSPVHLVEGLMLPGDRPIMVSDPQLMQGSMLPGNRPIASNDIDDPASLMGYID
ncbi:hypothetical protein ACN4EK_21355 [Pantanalinema rosaneae CENA516]|uniref:hypothetical protein n=1 Tax=Pantanalinema rosaneae TaxID=1620701 RepID=UPI003D6E36DB